MDQEQNSTNGAHRMSPIKSLCKIMKSEAIASFCLFVFMESKH